MRGYITNFLPFTGWIRNYRVPDVRLDLVAALTVAVVAVPQGVRIDGSSVLIVDSLENRQPQDLWRDARRHLRLDA